MKVNLNDMPVLPFEKILGYLSLEDQLKSMAISRRWYSTIAGFRTKFLCFSDRSSDFIWGKSRLVGNRFAQNFIG